MFLFHTEKCTVPDDEVQTEGTQSVIVGQPLAIACNLREILHLEATNSSLTWYKSGNETPITKNMHSRIHQNADMLWFLPATFQDAGFYECIIRSGLAFISLALGVIFALPLRSQKSISISFFGVFRTVISISPS